MVDEVAELTVRDLGDDRAARAAHRAATGRLCDIARLGTSVDIHLVYCTQRPDAEAVPGQLKANLHGTVAFLVRATVNSFILLDSDRASLVPQHPGRAIWAHETVEEFQAVDCSVEESRELLLARWGSWRVSRTTGPVSQWMLLWFVKLLNEIDDGDGLIAVRAGPAEPHATHEGLAISAVLLPNGPLSADATLIDRQRATRSALGHHNGHLGGPVGASPCGVATGAGAVELATGGDEGGRADWAAYRPSIVPQRDRPLRGAGRRHHAAGARAVGATSSRYTSRAT